MLPFLWKLFLNISHTYVFSILAYMKLIFSLFATYFSLCTLLFGQKKPIDHTAYKEWKKLENVQISKNGALITYEINPQEGDGYLYVYHHDILDSFLRGSSAELSNKEEFVAFTLKPGYDTLRKCELNEIPKKKWPKDSLFVYYIHNRSLQKFDNIESWSLAEKSNKFALLQTPKKEKEEKKEGIFWFQRKEKDNKKVSSDGFDLKVVDGQKCFEEKYITEFKWSEEGSQLAFLRHERKDKEDHYQLIVKSLDSNFTTLFESPTFRKLFLPSWNSDKNVVAFLASQDTTKEKQMNLYTYDMLKHQLHVIGDLVNPDFDTLRAVSSAIKPEFIENSKSLYFGITDRLVTQKDSLLDREKPKLDIWHYEDAELQPRQHLKLKNKANQANYYLYNTGDKSLIALSNDSLKITKNTKLKGNFLLATSENSYAIQNQWSSPWLEDYYLVNVQNGKSELLKKEVAYAYGLSPKGAYFAFFDINTKQHYLLNVKTKEELCLTCNVTDVQWCEDVNGQPRKAGPRKMLGFDKFENTYFFQSEFDVWAYDISGEKLHCLTQRKGEKQTTELKLIKWEEDSAFIDLTNVYIYGKNTKTKSTSLFEFYDEFGNFGLYKRYSGDFALTGIQKSQIGNTIALRKMTLAQYPELSILNKNFQNEKQISCTNPQQVLYNWASVQQISWQTEDSILLDGLLYLPEDYDSSKTYPMLVYFYELSSDRKNTYLSPRPSASTINPLEYASSGYIVFIPDIRYTHPGRPAKSAFNCIVSGTDYVLDNYPVDSTRIGLQGQSWGGYQTAQLITMTQRYAAAMAGAPVANMFSAYGGMRWGSGLNRQFQYEATQSRIGKTIWEAPELYFENSPLFHLPQVTTPLLIMHNDEDGAVPWYQGIELFNGMRRLNKPCWMLTYNGDDHNLLKNANRLDLSIRMKQFFDHYLMGKPMPYWMKKGRPAIDKDKELRYELD